MIYIHIPYCRSFCTYCDFYSEIPTCGFGAFTDALCAEIGARWREIPWESSTLYIGGGTPSVMPVEDLRRIVTALGPEQWEEFTVEVNPDDVVRRGEEYVRALAGLGVNRISMGVQSLDDGVLRWMNRRHDAATAREAYRIVRSAGIGNVSVDLIFGYNPEYVRHGAAETAATGSAFPAEEEIAAGKEESKVIGESAAEKGERPGQCSIESALEEFGRTVEEILNIGGDGAGPEHISAYQLSVEPGSELAQMVAQGRYVPASDELCAREYELLCGRLREAGYRHYEISNFAQPGRESRHNSAYWRHVPYIGFGPAAHSFFIDSKLNYIRRWNEADIGAYLQAARGGDWDGITRSETLTAEQIREEKIMLGLRTSDGVPVHELLDMPAGGTNENSMQGAETAGAKAAARRAEITAKIGTMIQNGSLAVQGSRIRIPENRFFISDDIISDLI